MNRDYLSKINASMDDEFINQMKDYASMHHVPIMQDEGIRFLIQLIQINHAKKVLEIGTAIGYSAIMMASFGDVQVTSIERDPVMYHQAKENVNNVGLDQQIELIYGDAKDVSVNGIFDIVFIDAAKASYKHFFDKYSQQITTGGLIISDNLLFHGHVSHPDNIENRNLKQLTKKIHRYNEYIVNHPGFDTYIYPIGDGIGVSIKK